METGLINEEDKFDIAIVGGGLAGLSSAIQLTRGGHRVILFEKEKYPFHRVCGEYVSMESWNYLVNLGIDLPSINPPVIRNLQLTTASGKSIQQVMSLGGFGISRYFLDNQLAEKARSAGVTILENCRVTDINFYGSEFIISCTDKIYSARVACGSFGKRSNLDIKWKRPFTISPKNKLNNYIGVKYHIYLKHPVDTISLHVFDKGYCGLVKIEGDKYNLCYLSTADNLQKSGGSIRRMEETILSMNPFLKEIFLNCKKIEEEPVTISQISFDNKNPVENNILMLGDAAGMITPLCGNGMSMALHSGKLASENIHLFLIGMLTREKMEKQYSQQWEKQFSRRLAAGRKIQRLSGNLIYMNLLISAGSFFPPLIKWLIRQTHGQPY